MWFRILLALTLGYAGAVPAPAASAQPRTRFISLRECIELALTRNLDIRISRLHAEMAGYTLTGAYGPYVPVFSFRARHEFVSQPGDFDPQKFNLDQPYEMNTDLLGPALTGNLPIGMSYHLSGYTREDNARTDFRGKPQDAMFFPPDGIRRTNNYFSELRVDLQQHLLKDLLIDAERQTIQVRRKELKISEQAFRFQVMKAILAVELSYYDLVAARETVKVQQQALQLREQFVKETARRVELGDLPPLENEQAQAELETTKTALAAAQDVLESKANALKALIGDDFNSWADIDLAPVDTLTLVPVEVDRAQSIQSALKTRPDLKEARLAVEQRAVVVKYRKNQLLPSLDLVGRYGGLGVDTDPAQSINNAASFDNSEYFYGAVVSLPLSLVAERGNYRASEAAKEMSELQLKKAEQEVLWQVADYAGRVQMRLDQVNSTRKARDYAERAYEAEQKKLANGLSTTFVVLQLQTSLIRAQTAAIQALADYRAVVTQLAFADGTILEKRHLEVELR